MSDLRRPEAFGGVMEQINSAINLACTSSFGVLDSRFLCQSISSLSRHEPACMKADDTVAMAVDLLSKQRVGSLLIIDEAGKLIGIFTERDYILKVASKEDPGVKNFHELPVKDFMTVEPVVAEPDTTIAFALNLMSHGGFRHIPIIDSEGFPVGIISVKDVIDAIVGTFMDDLLNFEIPEDIANPKTEEEPPEQ